MRTVQLFLATALALLLVPTILMAAEKDPGVAEVDVIIDDRYLVTDDNRRDEVSVTSKLIEFSLDVQNPRAIPMPGKGWKDVCIMTFTEMGVDLSKFMSTYVKREGTVSLARFRFDYIPFEPTSPDENNLCN